jgi:hypothetical protein
MQKNRSFTQSFLSITLIGMSFATIGCSQNTSDNSNNNPAEVAEIELCSTSTTYTTGSIINGNATFSKRGLTVNQTANQVTRLTLGGLVQNIPIKFAEVRVLNSAGTVVQCGRTNSAGALKALDGSSDLRIPATAGTYVVEVLSRASYSPAVPVSKPAFSVLFSIKEDIYSNVVHRVTKDVVTNGAGTYGSVNLNATAAEGLSAKIEGGAFNIFNDIITSYEYLANNTGVKDISCLNPKMSVYWKAGFNPAQYIYPSKDPGDLETISFYIRTDKELYINGGVLGDVAMSDTDHFDDSVVIHELGHHIENVCGVMESPGGSHSGSARIDARLAWSEAWGNFFGAHIIRNNTSAINPNLTADLPNGQWLHYFDSFGYTDGPSTSGREYIKFNLARLGNVNTSETIYGPEGTGSSSFDAVDSSANPGEGHFREVAIARGLFKSTNTCASPFANCANEANFEFVWNAFEKTSSGMGQTIYPFRSSIRWLERFKAAKSGSLSGTLTTIFETQEAMQQAGSTDYVIGGYTTWVPYGIKLVTSGSTCPIKIIPKANTGSKSDQSDQRYSNHFFYVNRNELPGVTQIKTTSTSIDLLLLSEGYRYNEDCNGSTCSKSISDSVITSARSGSRIIDMSSAPTTTMLNVRVYTPGSVAGGTEYIYQLTDQTGAPLCPQNSF